MRAAQPANRLRDGAGYDSRYHLPDAPPPPKPPPPPPNLPAIEPDIRGATTIREQLEKHRTLETCNACHANIDPPGFALENFDVMGGWRDRYRAVGGDKPVKGIAKSVRRVTLPIGKDAHDFFAGGGTAEQLTQLSRSRTARAGTSGPPDHSATQNARVGTGVQTLPRRG